MQASTSASSSLGDGGLLGGVTEGLPAPTSTPIGGRSFASPAMIRILLTPAHPSVTPDEFEMMAGVIRRFDTIRLTDLPKSQSRGETVASSSILHKMGEVHISFITSYDPGHNFLAPFNLHRQVLGVLGLSTLNSISSLQELEHSPGALRQLHPSAIVHRVFAFDTGASRPQTVDLSSLATPLEELARAGLEQDEEASPSSGFAGRNKSGLVVFPSVRKDLKDVKFYLKTLLPDFVGGIVDGLDTIIKGLQGKSLETPRETLDDTMTPSTAPTSPVSTKFIATAAANSAVGTAASRASALFSSFSAEEKKASRNRQASQSLASIGPMGAGRYAKVKADYYLLSGDLWNALHTYDSCTNLLGRERAIAGGQDAVWYASALEGWAVTRFLVMRMGGAVEGMATCLKLPLGGTEKKEKDKDKDKEKEKFHFHDKPWSDIAEAYSLALTMYTKCLAPPSYLLESWKSITPDTPRDYTHPLIHSSACLAYARLLLAVWASGGWNGETCDQLLYGGTPPALAETTRPTQAVYTQHCTASGIQRGDIAAPASLSMTNSSTNGLKMLDQIHLFSSLASIFGAVGFVRKEAYSIRRLQALVVSLIVSGVQLQKKEPTMASQVIRTVGDEESQIFGTMTTMIFSQGAGQNADSILVLALQICQTYGIDIEKMPITGLDERHILSRASIDVKSGRRLSSPLLHRGRASWGLDMTKVETEDWQKYIMEQQSDVAGLRQAPHFGWVQQQILILKDTLGVCEVLQDEPSLLFFAAILLRDFWPFLSIEDQVKLKEGVHKVQISLVAKGQETMLEYWGPALILDDLQIVSQAQDVEQTSVKEAVEQGRVGSVTSEKRKSRKSALAHAATSVFIDGQSASFIVTLFNPMSVSLEVEMIRMDVIKASSIGPRFEADEVTGIVIPASSYQTVLLTGTPHGEGKLLLRGVQIKLKSCLEKSFALERTDGEHVKVLAKLQSDIDDRWTRTKQIGLDARSVLRGAPLKPKGRIEERHIPLQVIDEVPLLLPQSTASLRNGSVALLEGQERDIHLVLVNRSKLSADYIRFDFEDDLQSDMLDLLAEGHLDPVHVYELEEELLHRPFITPQFKSDKEVMVPAGGRKTFTFRIRGKIDLRRACIKIQYGNIQSAKELGRDQFWTRKAEMRFDVRVQPVIAIDGLEASDVDEEDSNSDDKVLLGMRIHNLHTCSVSIDWQYSNADSPIHHQLAANTTSHVYVLMKRLSLSRGYLSQAIPNLIDRQFIFSKRKQTAEQDRQIKKQFWTRAALIDSIQIRKWTDDRTGQSGEISISGLRCDDEHLVSMLNTSPVRISTRFIVDKPSKHEFVRLKATVKNASDDETLHAHYKLMPIVHERLINHIQCTSGHLHGSLCANSQGLDPGKSKDIEIGLCFLASGTFTFLLRIVQQQDHQVIIAEKRVQIIVS